MRNMYYIDMHCHTAPKPYSWSLKKSKTGWDCRNVKRSIWYNDPPKGIDKCVNRYLGLTRFTQSDFRTQTKGEVRIMSASLSPIERALVVPKFWPTFRFCDFLHWYKCIFRKTIFCLLLKLLAPFIIRFIGLFGMKYIFHVINKNRDYFDDLLKEYIYYICEESKQTDEFPTIFQLTREFNDIDPKFGGEFRDVIYVFFSIEGGHVFNNGGLKESYKDEKEGGISSDSKKGVMERIEAVKKWKHRPLFVSIAHHMKNDLCGHARSLTPPLERIVDQEKGMDEGFKDIGKFVVKQLLREDNGNRIYIDIKHMSKQSREDYYKILHDDYKKEDIPVFASHGAVNGRNTGEEWHDTYFHKKEKKYFSSWVPKNSSYIDIYQNEDDLKFNGGDVNFFNDEIIIIERTGGFLGIQIDERRLCTPEEKKHGKKIRKRGEQLYHQAGLVWKQIRYIAKVLDDENQLGWHTAAIGSDFDGLVDPPNGYWSSEDYGILEENLIHHAFRYFYYFSDELNLVSNRNPAGKQTPINANAKILAKANILAKALARALAKALVNAPAQINAQLQGTALIEEMTKIKKQIKDQANAEVEAQADAQAEAKKKAGVLSMALAITNTQDQAVALSDALAEIKNQSKKQVQAQAQAQARTNELTEKLGNVLAKANPETQVASMTEALTEIKEQISEQADVLALVNALTKKGAKEKASVNAQTGKDSWEEVYKNNLAKALTNALANALAQDNTKTQTAALTLALTKIKEQIKEQANSMSMASHTGKEPKEEANEEKPANALVVRMVRLLSKVFVPCLILALVKPPVYALIKAICEKKQDPPTPVQGEIEAMNNAKMVVDLFMRRNALRFLKDYYKKPAITIEEDIECPPIPVKKKCKIILLLQKIFRDSELCADFTPNRSN